MANKGIINIHATVTINYILTKYLFIILSKVLLLISFLPSHAIIS